MTVFTYKKAVCGTKRNRIVTLDKDESEGGLYYVRIQYDYHTANVFKPTERQKAYNCFYKIVEDMELTTIDEARFNIQQINI